MMQSSDFLKRSMSCMTLHEDIVVSHTTFIVLQASSGIPIEYLLPLPIDPVATLLSAIPSIKSLKNDESSGINLGMSLINLFLYRPWILPFIKPFAIHCRCQNPRI